MGSVIRWIFLGLAVAPTASAWTGLNWTMGSGASVDVGPEAGATFGGLGQAFLFRGRDEVLVSTLRGGIYRSLNSGQDWVRSGGFRNPRGMEPWILGLCQSRAAPHVVYAVTYHEGIAVSDDFGETWGPLFQPIDRNFVSCDVDPFMPKVVYAVALPFSFYGS